MIRRRSDTLSILYLTVDTRLSPNLAKSVVDGGRLATISTICSPPPVVPQDGLSREIKLSPPSSVVMLEGISGWTVVGLVVRGGLGSTIDVLRRRPPDIFASIALVEVAGLLVAAGSKAVPAGTVHCRVISSRGVE